MDILCATDDCYAPYCGVMLTSLFENNKNHQCRVFIFVSQPLKRKNTRRFTKLSESFGQQLSFITVDDAVLQRAPRLNNSLTTYYRLFAEKLLPDSVKKVLYLDVDLIVTRDLSPLWDIEIAGKAIAAVTDIALVAEDRPKELHYPVEAGYFNAGVLLMNLDYWRRNRIGQQILSFLENHYNILRSYDQDVLNAVLWDKKRLLPISFNLQIHFLKKDVFDHEQFQEAILEAYNAPSIIHFSGLKPWSIAYYGKPFHKTWDFYKKLSLWSHVPSSRPERKVVRWLIKRFVLWPLGVYNSASDFILIDTHHRLFD